MNRHFVKTEVYYPSVLKYRTCEGVAPRGILVKLRRKCRYWNLDTREVAMCRQAQLTLALTIDFVRPLSGAMLHVDNRQHAA